MLEGVSSYVYEEEVMLCKISHFINTVLCTQYVFYMSLNNMVTALPSKIPV